VLTVIDPAFQDTQVGTLHFHHLTSVNGGLLHAAQSVEDHARLLGALMALPSEQRAAKSRQFVEGFIRPAWLTDAPSTLLIDALLAAAKLTTRPGFLAYRLGLAHRRFILSRRAKIQVKANVRKALDRLRIGETEDSAARCDDAADAIRRDDP
jgi:hypothetical protein